jgi:phosphoribosylanthranilate isomerase
VGIRVVKAFRFGLGAPPVLWQEYSTEYFLCDTFDPTAVGGTGKALDLSSLPEGFPMEKTFLAGGLNPETVAKQVQRMHPFAVDVSSGVEVSPGIKCPDRVRRFIQGVRQVQALPE